MQYNHLEQIERWFYLAPANTQVIAVGCAVILIAIIIKLARNA